METIKKLFFPRVEFWKGKMDFSETSLSIFRVILMKICHILNVENFVNASKKALIKIGFSALLKGGIFQRRTGFVVIVFPVEKLANKYSPLFC